MEAYQNTALSPEERAKDLLGRMTLKEKVGQLNQRLYGFRIYERQGEEFTLTDEFKEEVERMGGLGVLYGLYRADPWADKDEKTGIVPELSAKAYNMVQHYVMEHSRLGIPMMMSSECPHGHQALGGGLLPVNLAAGATFDPALLSEGYKACGKQLKSGHVELALMSALDMARDPRWGRSEECYSEDPCLAAAMAKAAVTGMQSTGVGSVAKHFCAQGETTGGVNASAARIGERELREIHFPSAKACCEAGVEGIMAAYNEIDGVYCHRNAWLLRDVLRGEMGFDGIVMADGLAVDFLKNTEGDTLHAAVAARKAGVDVSLWDEAFGRLGEAVDQGLLEESQIDEAVLRVLKLKFEKGLFEHPYMEENMLSPEEAGIPEVSLALARESAVLLNGIYAVGDVSESWSFHNGNISYEDYMKQCEGFTASKFDAKKWAELFQKAGAQYVVMTAKHHDGVALFDTGYSDLSVVKKTPAARDLVKEYTAAMREAGLKVGLYYSLIDWSDPRYRTVYPEGMKKEDCLNDIYGSPAGKEEEPEKWQEFLEFNNHQLKELMSNYGTVDLLWFDGDWERSAAQWKMPEFREYLHTLNPNVVLNSRMQGYGDYETPEQGIPLYGPKGEWEFCTTINDSWGYRPSDNDYKSSGQIVRMFCDCITLGGRMLLDIGPKEDGTLDERQEKVLLDLGGWIHDHEEAVFGTEKGLDYNHFLGGSTISADKKTMYLFVYDKPQETLCVKGIKTPVKRVTVLHTGEELRFSYTGSLPWSGIPGTLWIWAGEMSIHPFATVVKVELEDEITYNLGHGEVVTFNE